MKSWKIHFSVPGNFSSLPFLRRLFPSFAAGAKNPSGFLNAKDCFCLTHILVEAYNNAIVHGHRGKKSWVELEVIFSSKKVVLKIGDEGKGWKNKNPEMPKTVATRGRGLALIRALGGKIRHSKTKTKHWVHIDYKKSL